MFSSLRVKMLAMFVVLTMVPLIAVGIVSYQKSFRTISDHSKAAFLLAADRLARDIDVLFQDTMRLLELENHQAVLRYLFSQTDSYADAKDILQAFDLYRKTYRNDKVLNISMVNLYGRGISERKGVFALNQNPLRNPHFQHLMNAPADVLIVPPDEALPQDRLDGFQYEIDVPPEFRPVPILKMTLQPIVENALYHGIKNKRGKGRIRIAGEAGGDGTLRLSVTDNGRGMEDAKLAELRRLLDDPPFPGGDGEPDGGYGLLNVQRRLRLYYGPRFGVAIDSREGLGTRVEIAIPIPMPIQGGNRLEESVSGGR